MIKTIKDGINKFVKNNDAAPVITATVVTLIIVCVIIGLLFSFFGVALINFDTVKWLLILVAIIVVVSVIGKFVRRG